jgi:nucleoside-triphosphatase THEP1
VAAFGGEYGGYLAYQIIRGTPRMEFYIVLVDPGNGHVLATQKASAAELEKMHMITIYLNSIFSSIAAN